MDRGKWTITLLLFISVALTASKLDDDGETIALSVWVGQEVDLQCADNLTGPIRRLWKRGDEILLFMNEVVIHHDRVSSVNSSAIMRIVNVTLDDEGYYTCTAFTRPPHRRTLRLQVKEKPCEAPLKPVNGDYESDTDTYRTGDTITYHCHRGYRLIGQSNRTCTGTSHNGWQPEEPYCQSEDIGHLMTRLDSIDDRMTAIEQRLTTIENNTSEMDDRMSAIDSRVLANHNKSADLESRLSSVVVDTSSPKSGADEARKALPACSNGNVSKCLTVRSNERNGHNVIEYEWVIEDYNSKVSTSAVYYSPTFYSNVPGYRMLLTADIKWDIDLRFFLFLLSGDYDDQLTWPLNKRYDLTVLMKNGTEVLYSSSSSGENSRCHLERTTSNEIFKCFNVNPEWSGVFRAKDHISNDGSVVVKLYLYD